MASVATEFSVSVVEGQVMPVITLFLDSDGNVVPGMWKMKEAFLFENPVTCEAETLPAGWKFDGATIPWMFWSVLRLHPFSSRVIRGAAKHDRGYQMRWDREAVDKAFHQDLLEDGVDQVRAWLMYRAVRMAGWVFYLKKDNWLKKLLLKII